MSDEDKEWNIKNAKNNGGCVAETSLSHQGNSLSSPHASSFDKLIMAIIPDGCILIARKIKESEIWSKPAWWFKVFSYLIMEVSYKDKKNKRGTGFFSYNIIYKECNLENDTKNKRNVDNVVRWMRNEGICTTELTTRGIYITLCNYGYYQSISNYKNDKQNDEGTTKERRRNDTITKEGKKVIKRDAPAGAVAEKLFRGEEKSNGPRTELWEYFLLKTKRSFKLTLPNRNLITERLGSYKLEELKKCVDNFVNDEWPGRKDHLDLIYCIGHQKGKPDAVEKWLNKPGKKAVRYL